MNDPSITTLLTELDWRPVWISLRVALSATALSLVIGTVLGYVLSVREFPGRRLLLSLALLPLVLPPTVLGYYLLVVIGRQGPLGAAWEAVTGGPLVFTVKAAVVAACLSTVPIVTRQLAAAFSEISADVTEAARIDGASGAGLFLHVHLPQIRQPLVAAATIAFARAVGDFGATLMVAGNIPGRTQTASIAIWDLMNAGRDREAMVMVLLVTVLSLAVMIVTTLKTDRPA